MKALEARDIISLRYVQQSFICEEQRLYGNNKPNGSMDAGRRTGRALTEKTSRKPFKSVGEIHSMRRLQRVHSDVCGPMPTDSIGGRRYFVTVIDNYTRCCKVYFMRNKSEAFDKFKEFKSCTNNECGLSIGTL